MSDDIVTRLRGAAEREYGCRCVKCEAADEIERLRRNTGCARNQGTTQFCAEALDAQRDVETLKSELVRNADEFRETLTELRKRVETLIVERDEARRQLEEADSEIEDLEFRLCGTEGELENALSRERTLLRDQEDCRIGADNLHAEIERLRADIDQMRKQMFENLEVARSAIERLTAEAREANANAKLYRDERDEARREICDMEGQTAGGALLEARKRGWLCFDLGGK